MKSVKFAVAAALVIGVAGCGASPEATIEQNCNRFEKDAEEKEESEEMCSCLAEDLKENMNEEGLEKVAAAFRKAKDGDDLERTLQEEGVSDTQMMAVMGAAKSCSIQGM